MSEEWTRREMKGIPASLGALSVRRGEEGWCYGVELDESHTNAQGVVHGGVLMTFMDHAMSLVIWEAADRAFCSTIQLDNHFLSALRAPAFVELDTEILKRGKSIIFARGTLRVGERKIMQATGAWSVMRKA